MASFVHRVMKGPLHQEIRQLMQLCKVAVSPPPSSDAFIQLVVRASCAYNSKKVEVCDFLETTVFMLKRIKFAGIFP